MVLTRANRGLGSSASQAKLFSCLFENITVQTVKVSTSFKIESDRLNKVMTVQLDVDENVEHFDARGSVHRDQTGVAIVDQ